MSLEGGSQSWSPQRGARNGLVASGNVRRRRLFRGALRALLISIFFGIFHVGTRVQVIQTGYEIRELQEEQERLKGENHTLRLEVATLKSPSRLEKVARELGLKRPEEGQVHLISPQVP